MSPTVATWVLIWRIGEHCGLARRRAPSQVCPYSLFEDHPKLGHPIEVVRAWYCFRCFASAGLEEFRCDLNSDGFVFDSQMICIGFHFLGISCPTHCQPVAAPTEFGKSLQDGMGMFKNSLQTRLSRYGWPRTPLFGGS